MSLAPLTEAPWVILAHVAAVVVSLLLGPLQLILPKGSRTHRMMGRVWSGAMVIACISALLIFDRPMPPNLGPISWLHLLAVFTLVLLYRAVRLAQAGKIEKHRKAMLGLVILGLGVPAVFAFMAPGRILNRVLFETQNGARPSP
ncbi:MAG: DUF2306 domain-containing protein [Methylocella sp.]